MSVIPGERYALSSPRILVRNLATAAEAAGRSDLLPLWAGHSAPLSRFTEVTKLLGSLVEEVSEIAGPVVQWSTTRGPVGLH